MYTHNCHLLGLCEGFDIEEESEGLGTVLRGKDLVSDVELKGRQKYWYGQFYPLIYEEILKQYLEAGYTMGRSTAGSKGFMGFGAKMPTQQIPFREVRQLAKDFANKYATENMQAEEQYRQATEAQRIGTEKAQALQASRVSTGTFKMPEGVIGFKRGVMQSAPVGPAVIRPIETPVKKK